VAHHRGAWQGYHPRYRKGGGAQGKGLHGGGEVSGQAPTLPGFLVGAYRRHFCRPLVADKTLTI